MDSHQPTILVTGGTGFAGSHLIEQLLSQGYTNIFSTTFSAPDMSSLPLPADHYIQADLSNSDATDRLFARVKPDWVFHLAAFAYVGKSFDKARELFSNNINLQLNVLDAIRKHCPEARVLTIGSAEEYGMVEPAKPLIDEETGLFPVNPYAVSKVTQDLLAHSYYLSYKLRIIRARPFNHIGIRQTGDFAVPAFAKQIVAVERGEQQTIHVGKVDAIRDFTSVKDVVRGYIILMEKGTIGQVYNIGSGRGIVIQDLLATMMGFSETPMEIEVDQGRIRPLDVPGLIADNRKIRALGWEPVIPIETEIKNVLDEWRKK